MQSLQDFMVYRFSKKRSLLGRISSSSSDRSRFAACLAHWLDYFISGFVQGRVAVLTLFPREISPTGCLSWIAMVVIRQ